MRQAIVLAGVLAITSGGAEAGVRTKMAATFEGFPAGTSCGIEGAQMPVIQLMRDGAPRIFVAGFASIGRVYCDLPDGRRVGFDINKRLRPDAGAVGFRVKPNGRATMTTHADGELVTDQLTGVITPW
ncbi:hypothetical protein [uncultured Roseobacter sp.]|uniref:hypothetical protein n=1 Tax=uncultured Roseobacter sp. TaxID=114847 RepID=UPI00260B9655|nr:hypothetical protein [uncultured Roseobacter sp.]